MENRWDLFSTLQEIIGQRKKRMVPENSSMAPEKQFKLTSFKLSKDYSASYLEYPEY